MAAQARGSKGPGNRPASKGNRPGQGGAKASAKSAAKSGSRPADEPTPKPTKPAAKASSKPTAKPAAKPTAKAAKSTARPAQSSAARRQAASKAVARARTGGGGNSRVWWTVVPIAVIAAVVITLVGVKLAQDNKPKSGKAGGIASAAVFKDVTQVPASVLTSVGTGSSDPTSSLKKLTGAPLTTNGLPQVLYVGAEWCPYCAAERWSLAVALSRFGTFNQLLTTTSSPTDAAAPSTATLSFHDTKFTSSSLVFTPYEMYSNQVQGNGYKTLDTVPEADLKLFESQGQGSYPFISFGGKYMISGATYDPKLLAGMDHEEIAQALQDPSSKVAKAVLGSANVITAVICNVTGGKPANVCTAPSVKAASAKIPA